MKLTDLVAQYVTYRKALGASYYGKECILRSFCRSLGEKSDIRSIRPKAVSAFLAGDGHLTR